MRAGAVTELTGGWAGRPTLDDLNDTGRAQLFLG
jgi:hypothetical protein